MGAGRARVGQSGPYKAPASVTAKHKTWRHYIRRYTSTVEAQGRQMNVAGGTSEALDYIQRNYLHEAVIKHPQRAEAQRVWNFPYAAVEEALKSTHSHGTGVAARLSRQRNAASSKKP